MNKFLLSAADFFRLFIFSIFLILSFAKISFAQTARTIKSPDLTGTLMRYQNFPSKLVGKRTVDVWLPANYSNAKKYSVLYMHDGQNLFIAKDAEGEIEWNVDETLQKLISEKKVRETIVVGIWNTPFRPIEFSPRKAFDSVNRKNLKNSALVTKQDALSDKYLKFIVNELKPFIDKKYSTKADVSNTFIMGSSMGALMSLYAISEYPKIFGGAACLSTQFSLGDGVMLEYMKKNLPAAKDHKVYFDYGTGATDSQIAPFQTKADSLLKKNKFKNGKSWKTLKFEGEEHNAESWSKRLNIPLEFLLGN